VLYWKHKEQEIDEQELFSLLAKVEITTYWNNSKDKVYEYKYYSIDIICFAFSSVL